MAATQDFPRADVVLVVPIEMDSYGTIDAQSFNARVEVPHPGCVSAHCADRMVSVCWCLQVIRSLLSARLTCSWFVSHNEQMCFIRVTTPLQLLPCSQQCSSNLLCAAATPSALYPSPLSCCHALSLTQSISIHPQRWHCTNYPLF